MRKKCLSGLSTIFTILFTLTNLVSFASQAQAAEVQTVFLHKRVAVSDKASANMLQDTRGINGAEYTIIDITDYVRNHPTSLELPLDEAKALTKETVTGLKVGEELTTHPGMKVVGRETTKRITVPDKQGNNVDTDGAIKLELNKKSGNYDASYLFIETASVNEATSSDNLIIHFPIQNDETGNTSDGPLHVYSKNDGSLEEPVKPSLVKELDQQRNDYSYGDDISYRLTIGVPDSIEKYQKFQVVDTPDPQLAVNLDSIKVVTKSGEEVTKSLYVAVVQDNGFVMAFDPQQLVSFKGEKLTILYQLKLKAEAEPDKLYVNKAYLRYNDSLNDGELESSSKEVTTGGYRFVKVDATNRQQKLEKAAFVVKNGKGEYLTKDYTWKTTKDAKTDDQLFRTISNKDGYFEVKGLSYGTYMIEETRAPDGYSLLDTTISFKVERNTYSAGADPAALLEVLNSKLPNIGGNDSETVNLNSSTSSKVLPSTGEIVKNGGVVIGILIIFGISTIIILQRKKMNN